ncbi:hypothetical protein PspLS_05624 [Pyricularia sp. CBS 133598]|nr:hypothetical protein PspLS_05624 [Pyricularia sp. CBS 133598]
MSGRLLASLAITVRPRCVHEGTTGVVPPDGVSPEPEPGMPEPGVPESGVLPIGRFPVQGVGSPVVIGPDAAGTHPGPDPTQEGMTGPGIEPIRGFGVCWATTEIKEFISPTTLETPLLTILLAPSMAVDARDSTTDSTELALSMASETIAPTEDNKPAASIEGTADVVHDVFGVLVVQLLLGTGGSTFPAGGGHM